MVKEKEEVKEKPEDDTEGEAKEETNNLITTANEAAVSSQVCISSTILICKSSNSFLLGVPIFTPKSLGSSIFSFVMLPSHYFICVV